MEEIKTNFDKIMEEFSECVSHGGPRKINFESSDTAFETPTTKKRRLSCDKDDVCQRTNNSFDTSLKGDVTACSISASPWETRRLKADLVEARSRVVQLRQELEQQVTLKSQTEILLNNKITALKKQCDYTSEKNIDLEKHVSTLRKRESVAKNELEKLKHKVTQQKQSYEDTVYVLKKENSQLREEKSLLENELTMTANDYKRKIEKLQSELTMTKSELEALQSQHQEFKEKASKYDEFKSELEKEKQLHSASKTKIKELEYDLASYGEWKQLCKTSQSRLSNVTEIEKELLKLRQDNKNLRDTLGDKLLLEEQVFDLKSRLEKFDDICTEASSLKVRVKTLEQELNDWVSIAKDHCPLNCPPTAYTLRSRIEDVLQKDVILTSEKGNTKNEKDSIQSKLLELQSENAGLLKANNDLKTSIKHHKNILMRVQKKLTLVAKERDCYRQLVENFEKDLTISGCLADTLNPESQLKARVDILEKTLNGYKEMCGNLEKELSAIKLLPDFPMEMITNTESYEKFKKEIETLRLENERLNRRKEELELELEHRCLKRDFDADNYKVVHFSKNPADEAYQQTKDQIERLQAEIERLRRKNRKLEEDKDEITKMNETGNLTVNVKEINTLRTELKSTESKMQHMKEVYKSATLEFREVCYMLFGYRVDRVTNANYRISSMYADSEDEYLNFRLNESGVLDMLETDYSISLRDMMRTHLSEHNSLPAFLSALTLELFNRTTMIL